MAAPLAAGAVGYVAKRSHSDELIRALRSVAGGAVYIDPLVAKTLVDRAGQTRSGDDGPLELSDREAQVLRLIALGHAIKEIASTLAVGVRTVETYRTRGMEKVGLKTRADVVGYAVQQGWFAS